MGAECRVQGTGHRAQGAGCTKGERGGATWRSALGSRRTVKCVLVAAAAGTLLSVHMHIWKSGQGGERASERESAGEHKHGETDGQSV